MPIDSADHFFLNSRFEVGVNCFPNIREAILYIKKKQEYWGIRDPVYCGIYYQARKYAEAKANATI